MSARSGRVAIGLASAALLAGLSGCAGGGGGGAGGGGAPEPSGSATTSSSATPRVVDKGGEAPLVDVQGADDAAGVPVRVEIPSLGISSRLDRLGVAGNGELERPPEWQVAGWYAGGPRPGDDGPAVIAGHVDSPSGPAAFTRLPEVAVGARVEVVDRDGATRVFRVDRLEDTPKSGFPTEAVYGPTPDAQLRLITCSGTYDATEGGYQDNLLVFATEVPS